MAGANLDDDFRVDALASFSHEVRTPVTAIRMVLDLAAPAAEGAKVLDAELLGLLDTSLGELTALLDALQDFSRAERGRIAFAPAPARLATVVDGANALLGEQLRIALDAPPGVSGNWDADRLSWALARLAAGVDRMGDASSVVRAGAESGPSGLVLTLESGQPGGPALAPGPPLAAFAFFAAGALVMAMGGTLATDLLQGYCRLSVSLPR